MSKKFWVLFFIVLISANFFIYLVATHADTSKTLEKKGFEEKEVKTLIKLYYILFAIFIIAAIIIIIMTLLRQNMQNNYF